MSTVSDVESQVASAQTHDAPPRTRREVSLSDRYEKWDGLVYLSGLQALVRIPLAQARLDRRLGRDTRTLISGYEGSPLAGLDLELERNADLVAEHGVVLRPNVNEELGANAVQGSQLASVVGEQTCDGVVGIWYGKAPGLDRATDALRHGNLGGASPTGGVLALVGDDSIAKSSTVPSSSEWAMAELGMTVLSPCDAQDVIALGVHGIALSRFCGLWTGLKLATNVVDGAMTVDLGVTDIDPVIPDNTVGGRAFEHRVSANFLQPTLSELECSLMGERPELARRYARENRLNRVTGDPQARIGLIAHGATYLDTLRALRRSGIDISAPDSGVRILKLGMVTPLEPNIVREFAEGLDEIIVVEEKRAFVELGVKDVLYGVPGAPRVLGKRDSDGSPLLRTDADLPPEVIARAIASRLERHVPGIVDTAWADDPKPPRRTLPLLSRQPFFCSGCPHNTSTQVPQGSLVGAGIGCSSLASYMDEDRVGQIMGLCQMGGEGAAWAGIAPFVRENHVFQNLGDGTYHHSGSLAIRAAVAAGVNITYKLLYNDAVAMTGGQRAVGRLAVPEIVRQLLAEGVARVVITTEDVTDYKRVRLPRGVEVRDRSRLLETQEELARVAGVTVLLHDQECATELRRKRKRKKVAEPSTRVFINERICEGCGDCGEKSNCLSVQPVETEYGRKTQIHQASCNKDYSCLQGDCPSFLTVEPGAANVVREPEPLAFDAAPEPDGRIRADGFGIRMTGIGGTGVVTTSQVLATAAVIDGLHPRGLDQLGMAQKGGAVVSDLVLTRDPERRSNKVGAGESDLYLAFDLLVATQREHLATMRSERTVAVVSTSEVPTGEMVTDVSTSFPPAHRTLAQISERSSRLSSVDARAICRTLFGDDQYANVFLLGVALQAGALPLSADAIEQALTLNGAAVDRNIQAFRRGRQAHHDPRALADTLSVDAQTTGSPAPGVMASQIARRVGGSEELTELVARRVEDLIGYQSRGYAERYAARLAMLRSSVQRAGLSETVMFAAVRHLYKLMAYKDEYEVARLGMDASVARSVAAEFGSDATWSVMLHPPLLRALGMRRKIKLSSRVHRPMFRVLRALRHLRGTPADLFGLAKVRRVERELVSDYLDSLERAISLTDATNEGVVLELAELPDMIRGYEEIKLGNVGRYRQARDELLDRLSGSAA